MNCFKVTKGAALAGVVAFWALGCGSKGATTDQDASVAATYSSISKNILAPGCVSCHGSSGGYSFESYAQTVKAVTAGKPASSPLYTAVSAGTMPKGGTPLTTQQIQAISDWITAGAAE